MSTRNPGSLFVGSIWLLDPDFEYLGEGGIEDHSSEGHTPHFATTELYATKRTAREENGHLIRRGHEFRDSHSINQNSFRLRRLVR